MRTLGRWTSGIVSRIDWMVSKVENQEALADSAIADIQRATARAKAQLARVRQDGVRIRHLLAEAQEAAQRWRVRACDCGTANEGKALECLRRGRQATARAVELTDRLATHEGTEEKLVADIRGAESRLGQLKEKRNLMRTRQSRAEALGQVGRLTAADRGGIDDIFERWETRITEAELQTACERDTDALEGEFITDEEEADLRAELVELQQAQASA